MQTVFEALQLAFSLHSLLYVAVGVVVGMLVGAMPGISATLGIALAIPFTFALDPAAALGLLAGIHNGASQGGAIPAILLRIPGTPGSVVTSWDGYPLAQQGNAGAAIQLSATSSAVGGMIGAVALMVLGPTVAAFTLAFGPPEMFAIAMFGIVCVSAMLGGDFVKGILSGALGIFLATVGFDGVTGTERFTFHIPQLANGIPEFVVIIGLFSLPAAWTIAQMDEAQSPAKTFEISLKKGVWRVRDVWQSWMRASAIGVGLGILPGSSIGAFMAYAAEKAASKDPESFGKGNVAGLAAAESVNNADNAAAMIPTLTLGVPGSAIAAMMLGALVIQGFQPGPQLFRQAPEIIYTYAIQMFLAAAMLIVLGGVLASRVYANILRLPPRMLVAVIVAMTALGAYSSQNDIFMVYIAFGFGVLGVAMMRFGFPLVPMTIGLVLGGQIERNFSISMLMSQGDASIFFTRPASLIIIIATILVISLLIITKRRSYQSKRGAAHVDD